MYHYSLEVETSPNDTLYDIAQITARAVGRRGNIRSLRMIPADQSVGDLVKLRVAPKFRGSRIISLETRVVDKVDKSAPLEFVLDDLQRFEFVLDALQRFGGEEEFYFDTTGFSIRVSIGLYPLFKPEINPRKFPENMIQEKINKFYPLLDILGIEYAANGTLTVEPHQWMEKPLQERLAGAYRWASEMESGIISVSSSGIGRRAYVGEDYSRQRGLRTLIIKRKIHGFKRELKEEDIAPVQEFVESKYPIKFSGRVWRG